jgi:hypothetical protein
MSKVLLFVASRDFNSPAVVDPLNTGRANHSRAPKRLGAAKKKKRARRTEGMTGLNVGARKIASGNSAPSDFDVHAFRH